MSADFLLTALAALSSSLATLTLAWLAIITWHATRKPLYIAASLFLLLLHVVALLSSYLLGSRAWYLVAAAPLTFATWHWHSRTARERRNLFILITGSLIAVAPLITTYTAQYSAARSFRISSKSAIQEKQREIDQTISLLSAKRESELQRDDVATFCSNAGEDSSRQLTTTRLVDLQVDGYTITSPSGKVLSRGHSSATGDAYEVRASWHRSVQSGESIAAVGFGEAGQLAVIAAAPLKDTSEKIICTVVFWKNVPTGKVGILGPENWAATPPSFPAIATKNFLSRTTTKGPFSIS